MVSGPLARRLEPSAVTPEFRVCDTGTHITVRQSLPGRPDRCFGTWPTTEGGFWAALDYANVLVAATGGQKLRPVVFSADGEIEMFDLRNAPACNDRLFDPEVQAHRLEMRGGN
jgi:hypothetical protein